MAKKSFDYTANPIQFIQDLYPMEGAFGPRAVIPPFLRDFLNLAFDEHGNPREQNVLYSTSKKQGKSSLAGGVALYMASRKRYSEVVIAAADKDQAKDRVFKSIKYSVANHPVWRYAKVYSDVIELDNASIIQALPFDWRGAAGGNYSAVIFDELHTYTTELHRRIWDELVIPPTQPEGVRWIASYAGFIGESELLWDVWQRAIAGTKLAEDPDIWRNDAAGLLAMIDQGERSWRMPWMTKQYMDKIRGSERTNTFRRLWLNEWTSNESEFIPGDAWSQCYDPELRPLSSDPQDFRQVVFGADASTTRDLTALVGVHYNEDAARAEAVYTHVWKPQVSDLRGGKATIDLGGLRDEILRLARAGKVLAVYYDPFQLHSIAVDLQKAGVNMIELPQTNARTEADQALYDAIIAKSLAHYGDPILTQHINNAVAIETARGYRLAKERTSRKIDAAVALSMAHYGSLREAAAPRWFVW